MMWYYCMVAVITTGADIGIEDWQAITALANKNGFMPFVDMAYLGFGDSLEQDGAEQFMADNIEEMVIATSCSKNFGLYRERTGAALLVGNTINNAQNAKGRILTLARASYTMPPDHGAALVADILTDTALTAVWKQELTMMQQRIIGLRQRLVKTLAAKGCDQFSFIADHKGMFSMTGLSPEQIMRLRDEFAIYAVGDGRVNIVQCKNNR